MTDENQRRKRGHQPDQDWLSSFVRVSDFQETRFHKPRQIEIDPSISIVGLGVIET